LAEAKQKDFDGGRFSQAVVGVQSGEQLENLGCQAEVWLLGLRGLGQALPECALSPPIAPASNRESASAG
jgi:hypothetical protein